MSSRLRSRACVPVPPDGTSNAARSTTLLLPGSGRLPLLRAAVLYLLHLQTADDSPSVVASETYRTLNDGQDEAPPSDTAPQP